MGRQVDKSRNKSLTEVKDKLEEEKAKPVTAEEDKNVKQGSLFSFANCLVLLLTVILAVLVPSAIVKTAELQQLNDEQDQTIVILRSEAENLKQKLQKSLSESESAQAFIKSNDKVLRAYQQNEVTLNEVKKKNEDQIQNLTLDLNSKTDSFEIEKNTVLEKLKNVEQEKLDLQHIHDLALTSIKTEKESETNELNQMLSKKEEEILTSSQTIKSLQEQSAELSDEKIQLSVELVGKSRNIQSLQQENGNLSNDFVLFKDESIKAIEVLKEEKKIFVKECEERISTLEDDYETKLDILENSRGQMMKILMSEEEELKKPN
eukprot:GFUD01048387.1.p1 GENE.GFUD01048387.1~~GFUD01048387.1.p1  ORF type:complete len:320 (+),score=110.91 GFUD01048387.1:55-1014(+)